MELNCPYCSKPIPAESINTSTEFADCKHCHTVFEVDFAFKNDMSDKILPPPPGSTLTLRKGDDNSIEVLLPAKRFGPSDILPLIYCILSIGAIVFATLRLVDILGMYGLYFCIPVWLNWLLMFGGFIILLHEEQIITINKSAITINKTRPIYSQAITISLKDIESIYTDEKKYYNPITIGLYLRCTAKSGFRELNVPLIVTRKKTFSLFEFASRQEQEWIVYLLNNLMKRFKAETEYVSYKSN